MARLLRSLLLLNVVPFSYAQVASAPSANAIDELTRLVALRDSGVLTSEEFELLKAQALQRTTNA